MTFEKGAEKPAKSGRKKGTPNKRTNKVLEILEEHGYDPLIEAIKLLKKENLSGAQLLEAYQAYEEACYANDKEPDGFMDFKRKVEENQLTAKEKLDGHLKLIKYIYPARKAIEIKSDDGKVAPSFTISLTPPKGD